MSIINYGHFKSFVYAIFIVLAVAGCANNSNNNDIAKQDQKPYSQQKSQKNLTKYKAVIFDIALFNKIEGHIRKSKTKQGDGISNEQKSVIEMFNYFLDNDVKVIITTSQHCDSTYCTIDFVLPGFFKAPNDPCVIFYPMHLRNRRTTAELTSSFLPSVGFYATDVLFISCVDNYVKDMRNAGIDSLCIDCNSAMQDHMKQIRDNVFV